MQLSVSFGHGLRASEIVKMASLVERSGFRRVWVSESTTVDALTVLSAIAIETERIELASGVVNVFSRSPTQIAMSAASIAELSGNRFTLGLGASSKGIIVNWHRMDYSHPVLKIEQSIREIKSRLSEMSSTKLFPSINIPIDLAAVGERMILSSKKNADGIIFFLRPYSRIERESQTLASHDFTVNASVVTCVADNQADAEKRVRKTIAFYITHGNAYRRFLEEDREEYLPKEVAQSIDREWRAGRFEESSKLVPIGLLEQVAIFGTVTECRRMIERYEEILGLTFLALQFNPAYEDIARSVTLLSRLL